MLEEKLPDTSVSPPTQPVSSEFKVGTYFNTGAGLYYVVKLTDKKVLIENCYTNQVKWQDTKVFNRARKEVIQLNA